MRTGIIQLAILGILTLCSCSMTSSPNTLQPDQLAAQREREELERRIAAKEEAKRLNAERNQENRTLIADLQSRGVNVHESARGIVINLPDVLFKFGASDLTSNADKVVSSIADVLKTIPGRKIMVEGHTDNEGNIDYNYTLSDNRAKAVAAKLIKYGVSNNVLGTRAFGESEPIASNRTSDGRKQNRRVEVIIENPAV